MRASKTPVELPHKDTMTLPDGRTIRDGDEFTVPGEGRFRFAYEYLPDGSVTAFGPVVTKGTKSWRSFRPDRIRTIHRTTRGRP